MIADPGQFRIVAVAVTLIALAGAAQADSSSSLFAPGSVTGSGNESSADPGAGRQMLRNSWSQRIFGSRETLRGDGLGLGYSDFRASTMSPGILFLRRSNSGIVLKPGGSRLLFDWGNFGFSYQSGIGR